MRALRSRASEPLRVAVLGAMMRTLNDGPNGGPEALSGNRIFTCKQRAIRGPVRLQRGRAVSGPPRMAFAPPGRSTRYRSIIKDMTSLHPRALVLLGPQRLVVAGCGSSSTQLDDALDRAPRPPRPTGRGQHRALRGRQPRCGPASRQRRLPVRPRALADPARRAGQVLERQLGAATGTFTPGTRRFAFASEHEHGGVRVRANRALHRHEPEEPGAGPVPRAGRPDERPAAVPQQAERRPRWNPGDLRGPAPLPNAGTYYRAVADRDPTA